MNSTRNDNLVDPRLLRRPVSTSGQLDIIENSGRRRYHALQLSLEKRESHGFSADVFYTWSRTLAYFGEVASVQDWSNIAASFGPASSDITHVLTFNYSYHLPIDRWLYKDISRTLLSGWSVLGINRISSGPRLTIRRDIRGDGSGNQRVNYVASPQYAAEQISEAVAESCRSCFARRWHVRESRHRNHLWTWSHHVDHHQTFPLRGTQEVQFRPVLQLAESPDFRAAEYCAHELHLRPDHARVWQPAGSA